MTIQTEDECPLCSRPMVKHTVLTKALKSKGKGVVMAIGWLCPKQTVHNG